MLPAPSPRTPRALPPRRPPSNSSLLACGAAPGCGDDHVTAVNLTRPLSSGSARAQALAFSRCQAAEEAAYQAVRHKFAAASKVSISHFVGGPCHPAAISCCVVPGGTGCGWTVLSDKEDEEDEVEAGGVLGLALEGRAHAPVALRGARPPGRGARPRRRWYRYMGCGRLHCRGKNLTCGGLLGS